MRTAYIGMGANLPSPAGPPEATLAAADLRLESLGRVTARSSLYSTAPVGFAGQPRFLNAAAALETDLSPIELLGALLLTEKDFGRNRANSLANGPRTIDVAIDAKVGLEGMKERLQKVVGSSIEVDSQDKRGQAVQTMFPDPLMSDDERTELMRAAPARTRASLGLPLVLRAQLWTTAPRNGGCAITARPATGTA